MLVARSIPAALLLALCSVSLSASAAPSGSPFAPGGPLEPWTGPLPGQSAPSAFPPPPGPGAPGPSVAPPVPQDQPAGARVDRDRKPPEVDDQSRTTLSAFINPVLMTFGKIGGRAELAPYGPHALFIEISRLSLDIKDRGVRATVTGYEYDFGYHLFPLARGARGFYIGPRYVRGSGETEGASGEFTGWGLDLGYQWVIANHLVFNLGGGAVRVSGTAQVDPEVVAAHGGVVGTDTSGFESISSESDSLLVPLVTLGLGFAL